MTELVFDHMVRLGANQGASGVRQPEDVSFGRSGLPNGRLPRNLDLTHTLRSILNYYLLVGK
jgi:hypothetical protein